MSGFLYKTIKNNKKIIKSKTFPFNTNKYKCKNNISIIGIGGNVGDSKRLFNHLLFKIRRDGIIKILATSVLYKNPPFGYTKQAYFYNSIILVSTKLQPYELLRYIQSLEKKFRRKREFKDAPRTLDLDIIFYEKRVINDFPKLIIPHYGWKSRESVLKPLKYLKGNRCLKRVLSHPHLLKLIN